MIKLFLYSLHLLVGAFVLHKIYQKVTHVVPFDPAEFRIEKPQFSDAEKALGRFGKKLFHDTDFSKNGEVACATCHQRAHSFADNQPLSKGIGLTGVNSPAAINQVYQKWFFWDGRVDTLAAQALQPVENPNEHGFSRHELVAVLQEKYPREYQEYFGDASTQEVDEIFYNFGRAIEQYEKGLIAIDSPFDRFMAQYVPGEAPPHVDGFGEDEWIGFQIFLGEGKCVKCHAGALFTDQDFHFTGLGRTTIPGRKEGVAKLLTNKFACRSPACQSLGLEVKDEDLHKVKTPSLRNVALTAPYFHDGSAATLEDAVNRYLLNRFKEGIDPDAQNIVLNDVQVDFVVAFLESLTSEVQEF